MISDLVVPGQLPQNLFSSLDNELEASSHQKKSGNEERE